MIPLKNFLKVWKKYLPKIQVNKFSTIDYQFLKEKYPIISLDKYIKGDISLNISRCFEIISYQKKPEYLSYIQEAINNIKAGQYIL